MRRFALEGRRQDLLVCAELLRLAPSPQHATYLMTGFEEAYRGRSMVGLPGSERISRSLSKVRSTINREEDATVIARPRPTGTIAMLP